MKPNDKKSVAADEGDNRHNAGGSKPIDCGDDRSRLISIAPAVRATLSQTTNGWQVDLQPMRAFEALRIWSKLGVNPEAVSLLFDVTITQVDDGSRSAHKPEYELRSPRVDSPRVSLGTMAERLSIRAVDGFDEDELVMDSMPLRELVGMIEPAHLRCVLVEGPIESRDARAMRRAILAGRSPLEAELRAAASLEVMSDQSVRFQCREKKQALRLVAERFRLYLSALRQRPIDEIAAPETWQVERLLDCTGTISLRPIETDMFSTFLDVGISTAVEPFSKPADCSLIYDVPSNTWHDER